MSLVEPTNDAPSANPNATPGAAPATAAVAVDRVDPPSALDLVSTLADLLEHTGLHHNAKFGAFVDQVRAFQRQLNADKSAG